MVRKNNVGLLTVLVMLFGLSFTVNDWGFFAHRKINYYAVLTVPPPVNQFFKFHIDFLQLHAVDPDRRRYAVPGEGARHFIDLDYWYDGDSLMLTRDFTLDRLLQGHWEWETGDSVQVMEPMLEGAGRIQFLGNKSMLSIDSFALRQELYGMSNDSIIFIDEFLYPQSEGRLTFYDSLTEHGIVPYHVEIMYRQLVEAMQHKDLELIVKICADLGHYIGDAHVPLHTTSNYNGQFTGQLGIHSFWESRIPELFEKTHFNSLVGPAEYIEDVPDFIWSTVLHSFSLVPSVLSMDKKARQNIAEQHHYCYEERGSTLVRTPCPRLAREYMNLMNGMVQEQWMRAIHAVGSVWYSAWIDSGQPEIWNETGPALEPDTTLVDRIKLKFKRTSDHNRSDLH